MGGRIGLFVSGVLKELGAQLFVDQVLFLRAFAQGLRSVTYR